MEFDAIILAGGRSSRLGGVPKAGLIYGGATLLERSLHAAGAAARTVVVGPDPGNLPDGVLSCREEPPYAGPAAAIAAGLGALAVSRAGRDGTVAPPPPPPFVLVLACDMPRSAAAVRVLFNALAGAPAESPAAEQGRASSDADSKGGVRSGVDSNDVYGNGGDSSGGDSRDGVMAVSADGRKQPLLGLYSTAALQRCAADAARSGSLENASAFALLARLDVQEVRVPSGSTDDVDTWDDASALGVSGTIPDLGPDSGPELRS
ncbi:molybdenum cofactor guanylyltransferase [Arthrobacter oryzae]|uniref:Molybdopterin-guanine dinucleotide biosynthesis protein A n=1 Tax=Arthrobacter oryzae TaxID=409290 RepID=A0A495E9U6_9MICC|nr:NTP transferase domain-containing protein [Arthrobacter oryzae]RKR13556.1 molybdopterin-guanine dinucleotide biosynthesis protein A [Arthrobacter oryzae]